MIGRPSPERIAAIRRALETSHAVEGRMPPVGTRMDTLSQDGLHAILGGTNVAILNACTTEELRALHEEIVAEMAAEGIDPDATPMVYQPE